MATHSSWRIFKILCRIAGDTRLEDCAKQLRSADDWNTLISLAKKQRFLAALSSRVICKTSYFQQLPEQCSTVLRGAQLSNTKRNMKIYSQVVNYTKALNEQGVSPLYIKGAAFLLDKGSTDIGFRELADIDVIIPEQDIKSSCNVALNLGYNFSESRNVAGRQSPEAHSNIDKAIGDSRYHHHITPLRRTGYPASIEIHRHQLAKRFHKQTSIEQIFSSSVTHTRDGITFRTPSDEQNIINLILGHFVHDGHVTRYSFPLRDACDYSHLTRQTGLPDQTVDFDIVTQQCGVYFPLFDQLVHHLMEHPIYSGPTIEKKVTRYLRIMRSGTEYPLVEKILHVQGRAKHLVYMGRYNPEKINAYLRRKF